MLNTSVRSISVMVLFVAHLALSGCADERPPPTRDEVLVACGDYNVETCRALQRCLGWADAEFWSCVNDENAKCRSELQAESCWENQRDALERCTADVADDTCSEICTGNICGDRCLYFCPANE